MKKALLSLLIIFIANISYSQDSIDKIAIFEKSEKAIALVSIAVKIDSSKVANRELVRRLESELGTSFLDNYCSSSLGSAFFISVDGYLVSNHHVVKYMTKKDCQDRIRRKLISDIGKRLVPGILTVDEIRIILVDLIDIIEKSDYKYIVRTSDGRIFDMEIVKVNQEDDLSLMKVNGNEKFSYLKINRECTIRTGEEVLALGYPLQDSLEQLFNEKKVTFTSGVVSAMREDNWGIQHTASINSGNSGGALLNLSNQVVGVNVGSVKDANSLFFAITTKKVVNWLSNIGYERLLN